MERSEHAVASANRERALAGRFRSDLFYRLHVLEIALPPLHRRPEDIAALVELFARRATAGQLGREDLLDDEAMAALRVYRWPGNVRELAAVVKRLSLFVDPGRPLGLAALPRTITAPGVICWRSAVRLQPRAQRPCPPDPAVNIRRFC